jgi:nicotinamidase/pyrazinamidase
MNHNKALLIIDAQRGFMPAEEGVRTAMRGFGELPVPDGQAVVAPLNKLTLDFLDHRQTVVTTQDWHPAETAHFSNNPNYVDSWPSHCVAGTPGASLHPELLAAKAVSAHFYKGDVAAKTPDDDTSYTGALAHAASDETLLLPDYLEARGVRRVYIGGLALGDGDKHPLCVDSTAIDLYRKRFDVAVLTDAVEAVLPENRDKCFQKLGELGIRLITTQEAAVEVYNTPVEVT